ncbi:putative bifunctional diguanylate cyclase/phosphodiesterase [Actinacidiphila guanduensis]|uniref:PAS domain S-box-containing protein/diguanylate cyclase (GGDEF) domain-containing protein n=1 Tax=Actinacidiphila guanduensis TaxID=310781 RepID=A0A1H0QAD6_9ACTN|nr:EAL domain-containing protein [Actinacidiphila guanduensis]SDP14297.1 PAS domain S-box-containing protein/diguanylate cyclase (GGDEF) domain-containing protein [Actinacidiphila guanduensis]
MTTGAPAEQAPHEGAVPGEPDNLRRFAAIWSRAVFPATATSMTRAEFETHLVPLARVLRDALAARPFDPRAAVPVGAALVAAHCTDPEALPSILGVIDAYLVLYCPPGDGVPADESRARCARLQHAVAVGFTQALRERTLAEQESISRAALAAQQEAERALAASEARFRAVFEHAAVGIGIADLDGKVVEVNDALSRMLGGESYIRRRAVGEWTHPENAPGLAALNGELLRGERDSYHVEKAYPRADGSVLWANLRVSLLHDAAGRPQYQLALLEDVTERRRLLERLRHEATHDALTGLPNRALFFERLDQALGTDGGERAIGLCYLDLDGFKAVNDSLGHAVGDRLLVAVAERLRGCLTGTGQLMARIGGDEFVALYTDPPDRAAVTALADRILAALATPVRVDGRDLTVHGSIGLVHGPAGEGAAADLLRSADITMYRAKEMGGNRYEIADPAHDARAITRHDLTNRLPVALERGEFFVEYQPLIGLRDGAVHGAEALVRWGHPVHGVLGPDRFIPLAENTGQIVPLGRWVLEQAARQAQAWAAEHTHGCGPRVNVNLSPLQLHHPDLVGEVTRVLDETGLAPEALCLEVTESALIGADPEALRPLRRIADLGVEIALDDFGTGYSNLSSLRWLPVSVLKLDRAFTRGMRRHPADPVDLKIVEGIVSLAHGLGLTVTVEGIETSTQAEHLRALGCDTGQGWYYGRPGPPERLHELHLADAG